MNLETITLANNYHITTSIIVYNEIKYIKLNMTF